VFVAENRLASVEWKQTRAPLSLVFAGLIAIGCASSVHVPQLVWNASASAPIGLYRLVGNEAHKGDLALIATQPAIRTFAALRGYLPANVPMVKRIVAGNGDVVCALGNAILVDGRPLVRRLSRDGRHRALPAWHGCRTLTRADVFLLMTDVAESFDGRYFGPTARSAVLGKLVPLWTE
jgi:conjugative transfer signal peptidase TraF